ncbi:MAG TPA: glucosaminidase domain-containing protein [Azonexus sp.]
MLRPEFALRDFAADDLSAEIAASAAPVRGNFAALFGEVRAEISDFIANGSTGVGAAPGLSAEGRFQQARLLGAASPAGSAGEGMEDFAASVAPWAHEAGARLGVAPEILTAHAALESGWGQRPLRHADGADTHNLFGLKAGGGWSGDVTAAATTEYENGVAQPRTERFRAYPDTASAFRDFAKLLQGNPRYQGALNTGNDIHAYAKGLVRGGYATDPAYGDKLVRVAARLQSGN